MVEMRLFGWFRPKPQEDGEAPAPQRWRLIGGRRMRADTPYVLPKDKAEGDRLELQHHMIKLAIRSNYLAPIRQPRAILDVACGTGIWCREMADQFKQARVVGFDIDRTPLERAMEILGPNAMFPTNFTFLTADALKPFPFEDGEFDFTHARLITLFTPITRWPEVVAEIARVTRRGGYVELVEFRLGQTASPAGQRLWGLIKQIVERNGMHAGAAPFLTEYLRRAGIQQIQERQVLVGSGRDAARQQRMAVTDFLAALGAMRPIAVRQGLVTDEEFTSIHEQAKAELPRVTFQIPFTFAFGRKP
jgi:ubiquinone/menaquinone biosynthesis C-methylase UbiE